MFVYTYMYIVLYVFILKIYYLRVQVILGPTHTSPPTHHARSTLSLLAVKPSLHRYSSM